MVILRNVASANVDVTEMSFESFLSFELSLLKRTWLKNPGLYQTQCY